MTKVIILPPVKRIEGHGRVSLYLDEGGRVADAHFDVLEFRGFEKMLEGRMVWEMPLITSRICGVCPVSHHLAAVKAVDALYGVAIPRPARLLRELLHLGGFSQDHALHFFFLAGPDFLTGDGSGSRDLLGVIEAQPEAARKAIALRKAGQRIVEIVGGRSSHPVAAIPGGMSKGITGSQRSEMLALVSEMLPNAVEAAGLAAETTARLLAEHPGYANEPVYNMAQMDGERFDLYDGQVRLMAPDGSAAGTWNVSDYASHIEEQVLSTSYANAPFLKGDVGAGIPDASRYRVGPLARLNLAENMPGEISQRLLEEYREAYGRPVHEVLAYHQARMIELVASVERMIELLEDDDIESSDVRVRVDRGVEGAGIAAIEAPRGTLIHHYEADMVGKVTRANLVVATTHNVASLDDAVLQAVAGCPSDEALSQDSVRKMELGIRAHDPCLSCATHEIGAIPLEVTLVDSQGRIVGRREVD